MAHSTVPVKKRKRKKPYTRSQLGVARWQTKIPRKTKLITIRVIDGAIVLDSANHRVRVHRNGSNQVGWTCPDGLFVVHFGKNGSPFDTVMFAAPKNKSITSGACNPSAPLGAYHYAIWVWADPAGPPLFLDPIVDVEDGGMIQHGGDES
ncbi:MAG TPA: hypothetical protein VFF24_10170 [Acidimicrobiia bacterium]|nr:hypothetical protein [Acidimicrobiia bacterium]